MKENERLYRDLIGAITKSSINEKEHTADVLMSTASLDRYRDVIMQDGWELEAYKKNPVLLSSHDYYSLKSQIGKALDIKVTEKGLEATMQWFVGEGNEEADWGWKLATKGAAAFSVGLIPKNIKMGADIEEDEDIPQEVKDLNPTAVIKTQELIENSQVTVPANPDALLEAYAEGDRLRRTYIKSVIENPELVQLTTDQQKLYTLQNEINQKDAVIEDILRGIIRIGGDSETVSRETLEALNKLSEGVVFIKESINKMDITGKKIDETTDIKLEVPTHISKILDGIENVKIVAKGQ